MSLELSRKRAKQLKKLRKKADKVWAEQKVVADHAAKIARDARAQAKAYSRETLVPGAEEFASRSVDAGRDTLARATQGWNGKVVPAIASGLASLAATAQVAKDKRVLGAIDNVKRYASVPEVRSARQVKSGPSALQWVLIGVGVVSVATAAYGAWQTLRADDDLWIPDSDDEGTIRDDRSEGASGIADGPEAGSPQE